MQGPDTRPSRKVLVALASPAPVPGWTHMPSGVTRCGNLVNDAAAHGHEAGKHAARQKASHLNILRGVVEVCVNI